MLFCAKVMEIFGTTHFCFLQVLWITKCCGATRAFELLGHFNVILWESAKTAKKPMYTFADIWFITYYIALINHLNLLIMFETVYFIRNNVKLRDVLLLV